MSNPLFFTLLHMWINHALKLGHTYFKIRKHQTSTRIHWMCYLTLHHLFYNLLALQMERSWTSVAAHKIPAFQTAVTVVVIYGFPMFLKLLRPPSLTSCSIFTDRWGYQTLDLLNKTNTHGNLHLSIQHKSLTA